MVEKANVRRLVESLSQHATEGSLRNDEQQLVKEILDD